MNKRKKIITILVTGALAAVTVFGALTYRAVYAQSTTPTPGAPSNTPNNNQAAPGQPGPGRGGPGGMRGGYTDQELATALGITTDQLQAAYTAANTEALKEAVSKGLITQAQADQLSANGFDPHRFGMFAANGIDYNAILAKALNITADKLKAAEQQAYNANIDAAVQSGAITQAQADEMKGMNALANDTKFQSALKSAYEAAVKQAVTDGVITQAQADAILLAKQSQTGGFFAPGFNFGPGGGFGHGHGGPGFNGAPGSNPNNPAPTTTPSTNG